MIYFSLKFKKKESQLKNAFVFLYISQRDVQAIILVTELDLHFVVQSVQ